MNRNKELLKNTFIIFIGKICTQLITFILLPIYTNYLSTSQYGNLDLIITYVSLLAPLISLQLEYAAFRYLIDVRNSTKEKSKIIYNVLIVLAIISILCLLIIIPIYYIFKFKFAVYLIIILVFTMFSNMLLQISRGIGDNLNYSIASFIAGVSNALISIFCVVFLKSGIYGILISMIISNFFCILFLIIRLKIVKSISAKYFNIKLIKKLLKYSLPMIPNSVCWWIISVSDRSFITYYLGASFNGLYSVSSKFSGLIVTIYNMFNLSWTESVSVHIHDDDSDKYLTNVFNSIICFFSCCCIGIVAILPFLFNFLIGSDYKESYIYIPFLILGSFFNIIMGMLSAIYIGKKKSNEMAKTSIIAAILNILINFILIKRIQIWAAVLSTIVSFACVSFYRLYDVQKYLKLEFNMKKMLLLFIIFCIVSYTYILNFVYLNILILITVIIISVYLNKEILLGLLKIFKKKLNK